MKKEVKDINVRDFLNEIDASDEGNVVGKKRRASGKRATKYERVVLSGCDVIISRLTATTNTTLVLLPSQGVFYIYDEKAGTKKNITEAKQIMRFFYYPGIDTEANIPCLDGLSYIKDGIVTYENIPNWTSLMLDDNPALRYLIKKGFYKFDLKFGRYNLNKPLELYEKNVNLFTYLYQNMGHLPSEDISLASLFVRITYECSDLDTAKYLINTMLNSSVEWRRGYYAYSNISEKLEKMYGTTGNVRRTIEYLFYDLYRQGVQSLSTGISTYCDYLNQCINYYGKVEEKYPKFLMTEHDVISQKLRESREIYADSAKFESIMLETEDFSYENSTDPFCIVMPQRANDLVDEGQKLNHCVASYVEKVCNYDCVVVFMRMKKARTESYLTVEILPDRSVPQVEGLNMRRDLSDAECVFLTKWAKARHLKMTAENVTKHKMEKEEKKAEAAS